MKFTKIQPYGPEAYSYWISGIYKIVSYRPKEYLAYYIPDRFVNWGDRVSEPPAMSRYGKCWLTLAAAKRACVAHAAKHDPRASTITRAARIKAELIAQEKAHYEADIEFSLDSRDQAGA